MGQNLKQEGQCRRELDKKEFAPHFKFWPNQPRKGSSPLLLQIFSLREKKNALALGLEKSNFDGKRFGEGGV